MALKCAHCGAPDTAVAVSTYQCYACGKLSNFDGTKAEVGPDENTRQEILRRLEPKAPRLVANENDLQRLVGTDRTKGGDEVVATTTTKARPKK